MIILLVTTLDSFHCKSIVQLATCNKNIACDGDDALFRERVVMCFRSSHSFVCYCERGVTLSNDTLSNDTLPNDTLPNDTSSNDTFVNSHFVKKVIKSLFPKFPLDWSLCQKSLCQKSLCQKQEWKKIREIREIREIRLLMKWFYLVRILPRMITL